ncbi:hypothetical protein [Paenibacillus rigui]|uniref:Uncharacterized protein n=1 Tax=Paenibacillus rigui TaxID=554312 RepID=A0A229UHJ6_9BACL|nr:hypothetical protein [Paenibacillus rigui]OXM82897.1 hypothetical protein CF651_28190 [Paenibacillus rigui]
MPMPAVPDASLDKVFDRKRVKLSFGQLAVNQQLTLTFSFHDDQTAEPITDLQPYLGAIGHVTILSQDGEQYLHVHGEEDQGSGPDAQLETSFSIRYENVKKIANHLDKQAG